MTMLSISSKIQALSVITMLTIPMHSAFADRKWDDANSPSNFDGTYIKDFSQLPLSGGIDKNSKRGWADSYWPKVNGYIADRWQVKGSFYKKDKSPSVYELTNLSEQEINLLSPAEKFDLARGKTSFPIATNLREKLRENEKDWRGLCNGWTHASLNIDEPRAIVFSTANNKKIPFGSGDIKGLLAYYYAKRDNSPAKFIGKTCKNYSKFLFNFNGACSDVHPASFHIMMANELGIKHEGFAADRDISTEVWNHPFIHFETRIDNIKTSDFSRQATEGTRKEIYISSTLTYVNELYDTENPLEENSTHVAPSYEPVLGIQKNRQAVYQYVLELNSRDRIIGGEWISENHPDLIWKQRFELPGMSRDEDDKKDDWSLLSNLIKMATDSIPTSSN